MITASEEEGDTILYGNYAEAAEAVDGTVEVLRAAADMGVEITPGIVQMLIATLTQVSVWLRAEFDKTD